MSTEINQHKKLLVITYYWPPAGGPGVQRWLKFVKYLPENGFTPIILTVDGKLASYAIIDRSLLQEIPSGIKVYRTKTKELFTLYLRLTKRKVVPFSGFVHDGKASLKEKIIRLIRTHLFIPDPRKGWNRFAIRKATELIKQEKIEYIVTTSPPHSSQLIGLTLKKKFPSIRWLADFRDPWTRIFYFDQLNHTFLSRQLHHRLEEKVITNSDRVVVVSNSMKQNFIADHGEKIKENKILVIPNGYDEEDFAGEKPPPDNDFTITYTGTLANNYRIDALIEAVAKINQTGGKMLKLRFVGEICDEYQIKLKEQIGRGFFELIPPVPHKLALEYLFRSHLLLLVIPDAPNNEVIVTGKLFEYLAAGKPILGIGPVDGDAAVILHQTKSGKMFNYVDKESLKEEILRILESIDQDKSSYKSVNIKAFSRKKLTIALLSAMNDD